MLKAGESLQEARLEKGLTLEEVAQATKIKKDFLESIEKGEYNKLPSVSYVQGFVRNYAKFLGLSEKEILALFRRDYDEKQVYRVLPKGFEAKDEFPLYRFKIKQTFYLGVLIFVFFIIYILFQYRYAFINPPLTIISPLDRQVLNNSEIEVIGKTDANSTVYVNKEAVSVDQSGKFYKSISVFPGNFVIEIKATNRFGKTTSVKKTVEIKPTP